MGQPSAVLDDPPVAGSRAGSYTLMDVCHLTGKSYSAFRRWIADGWAPRPYRIGRELRWPRQIIDDWLAAGCPRQP